MSTFVVGEGLRCDLDTLLETRLLVQANSGFGKSHTLRRILEQTHGHVQQLVVDTEGEFYTLREKFDYVLVAKDGGDTAADPRIASLLTRRLLELGASAVLDISELKPHERITFVRSFAETLVDVPRKLWRDALIVFDEAQIFCPQSGKAESMGPINDLMGRARKRGFCPILATLRLSMLHKDSANLCTNKLIGQGMEDDAKRGADNLGFPGREGWQRIQQLDRGDFYAVGPALSKVVMKVHIGPTMTSEPKRGALRAPAPPPTATIKRMLPQLSDLSAEAEQERQDNATLRRTLANVRRELTAAKREQAPPDEANIQRRVSQALITVGKSHSQQIAQLERVLRDGAKTLTGLAERMTDALNGTSATSPGASRESGLRQNPKPILAGDGTTREAANLSRVPDDAALSRSQQRVLDALSALAAFGIKQPHKSVVAVFAGASSTSGGYFNNLGRLRSLGLIIYPAGSIVALTDEGRSLATAPEEMVSLEQLHEAWCRQISGSQALILRAVIELYPEDIDKDELAEQLSVSPNSGGYFNNLGRLRSLGVIDYPAPRRVVATSLLFPEGLA